MKKRKLTTFKLITGIISGLLIIGICIFFIIQKINNNDNTYWQEIVLIILAIAFMSIIIRGVIYNYNDQKNKD